MIEFFMLGIGLLMLVVVIVALFAPRTAGNPPDWSHLKSSGTSAFWPPLDDNNPYYDRGTGDLVPRTRRQRREYNQLLEQIGEYGLDAYVNGHPYGMSEREFRTKKSLMLKRWQDEEARP